MRALSSTERGQVAEMRVHVLRTTNPDSALSSRNGAMVSSLCLSSRITVVQPLDHFGVVLPSEPFMEYFSPGTCCHTTYNCTQSF